MLVKAALIVSAFALSQAVLGYKSISDDEKQIPQYVDINGYKFFLDNNNTYTRDEAKTMCESINMKMVTFDDPYKWESMMGWLNNTGFESSWFWISAMKDEESIWWYWETTGAAISEFYWRFGQPSMIEELVQTCINFNFVSNGWDDDRCDMLHLAAMCD